MNNKQVKSGQALKPCPFCGGKAEGPYNETAGTARDNKWRISCTSWCASMYRNQKKQVLRDWNKRANDFTEGRQVTTELTHLVRLLSEQVEKKEERIKSLEESADPDDWKKAYSKKLVTMGLIEAKQIIQQQTT